MAQPSPITLSPNSHVYVPQGGPLAPALTAATTIGIGAHADDLELGMVFASLTPGTTGAFVGITCTDGAGSARGPKTAHLTNRELAAVRQAEQDRAAQLGGYAAVIQLGHPSGVVKSPTTRTELAVELASILAVAQPEQVVTHNIADRHATHIGVALATIEAIRSLPPQLRPTRLLGVEIWRGLDWLADPDKQRHPFTGDPVLARAMARAHVSQIDGKAYDAAADGRRRANATFDATHALDAASQVTFTMDMMPLIDDPDLSPAQYVDDIVDRFRTELQDALSQLL
jgi:LmbE family N-acetylglucosaminyl deacetylase